jgi:H+/gluconate symporter-like permease
VTGKLAGIIIGAVIGVILLLVIAAFLYKRHKRKQAALNPRQPTEEEEVEEKDVEAAPVVPGEMAYASQPAIPHSNSDLVAQQPKVVELGADGVVASSAK